MGIIEKENLPTLEEIKIADELVKGITKLGMGLVKINPEIAFDFIAVAAPMMPIVRREPMLLVIMALSNLLSVKLREYRDVVEKLQATDGELTEEVFMGILKTVQKDLFEQASRTLKDKGLGDLS